MSVMVGCLQTFVYIVHIAKIEAPREQSNQKYVYTIMTLVLRQKNKKNLSLFQCLKAFAWLLRNLSTVSNYLIHSVGIKHSCCPVPTKSVVM